MDNTSKMIHLLGLLRKEMNGAVADAMYYYGENYGLNYGVSLPTIRSLAQEMGKDHDFAKYLYKQQVRELRLAALHIAEPEEMNLSESEFWAEGVINSEVAEEMAFALLSHSADIESFFEAWSNSTNRFLVHSAMMAAAKSKLHSSPRIIEQLAHIVERFPEERIIAQSAVTLLAATLENGQEAETKRMVGQEADTKLLNGQDTETKRMIGKVIESLPNGRAKEYIAEEMEWRMEL